LSIGKKHKIYLVIILIMIMTIMCLSLPFFLAKYNFSSEVNILRKAGLPVTSQEFVEKYYKPVPTKQNALKIFKTAFSILQEPSSQEFLIIQGNAKAPWLDQELAPKLSITSKEYITKNIVLFEEMEKTKKYNFLRFNYDWENGYRREQIPADKLRKIFMLYAIRTEFAINRNDPQQAKLLLKHMFHINKLIRQEPDLLAQLVSQACESIIIARLERYMNMHELSSDELKCFIRVSAEDEQFFISQWPKIWQGLIVMFIDLGNFETLKKNGLFDYSSNNVSKRLFSAQFEFLSGNMKNKLLREIEWNKKIMNTPLDVYKKRKHSLEKIAHEAENKKILGASFSTSMCNVIYKKMLKIIAYLRCARTACAIKYFQLKHGKLPSTLHELVPAILSEIPLDPFNGNTLSYFKGFFNVKYEIPTISSNKLKYKSVILKKTGFYVYSVGENLKDEKTFPLTKNSSKSKNINFIVIDK
jgi:hypothetical protein